MININIITIAHAVHSWLTRCEDISIDILESLGEDENGEEEWIVKKYKY